MKKECKGKGLAKGNGCGNLEFINPMSKGLCTSCWRDWLLNTSKGQEYVSKVGLKAKKKVNHKKKKEKTEGLRKLMSVDAYRAKVLQPVINEIARLIDYGQPCIASGRFTGKMAGGHRKSVGTNRGIALNLHNIHIQSFESNSFRGGDERAYDAGIVREYGNDYLDYLISLENHTAKFSKVELEEAYPRACKFRNELKKDKKVLSPKERINKRNEANNFIKLYDLESFIL